MPAWPDGRSYVAPLIRDLTSDAGQAATGDPYQFVAECLASLALPTGMVEQLAVVAPQEMAARVFVEAATP